MDDRYVMRGSLFCLGTMEKIVIIDKARDVRKSRDNPWEIKKIQIVFFWLYK